MNGDPTDRQMADIDDLTMAIEAVERVRRRHQHGMMPTPDRDSTLAKAEYHLRGVRDQTAVQLGRDALTYVGEADDE